MPSRRARQSTSRMILIAGLSASLLSSACASDGRRSPWRFGPTERPARASASAPASTPDIIEPRRSDERASASVAGRASREPDAAPPPQPRPTPAPTGVPSSAPSTLPPATAPISALPAMSASARSEMRERALQSLLSIAASGTPEERANALEALASSPARLAGVIEPALSDRNSGLRGVAAMVVGKAKLESVADQVRPLLSDDSPMVRASAIYALRRVGLGVDPSPLGEMLGNTSPQIRAQAAYIMGELGEVSALGPLREAARASIGRQNPAEVRIMELQIAEARVKLRDDTALSDIRSALFPARSEDLEATALACQIAGQIRDMPSASQLINLTRQKDDVGSPMPPEIRLSAAGALAKLNRQPRNAAGIAREYANNPSDPIRAQSATVLGDSGDVDSLPLLDQLSRDPVGRVRVAASAAIVKLTTGRSE